MKKKIKDLTLEEARMICEKQKECNDACPFYSALCDNCKYLIDMFADDREVEIDEINND